MDIFSHFKREKNTYLKKFGITFVGFSETGLSNTYNFITFAYSIVWKHKLKQSSIEN